MTDARHHPAADNPGGADAEGHARRTVRPRDAASLIVWRIGPAGPEVLMGQRHAKHRFMPDVMVFPGGRVDADGSARSGSSPAPSSQCPAGNVGRSSIGTYTGDPPPGLMARRAFFGFQFPDRKVCGDVDAVVQVRASW